MRIRDRLANTGLILAGLLAAALLLMAGAAVAAELAAADYAVPAQAGLTQDAGSGKAAVVAEGEGEGEAEGEGEEEGEGEGEGEGEPTPPVLEAVTLLSPRGNVVAPRSMATVAVFFAAKVTLTEDAPAGTVPEVFFVLDGTEHPAVLHNGLWQTIADLPMGTSHQVTARAQVEIAAADKAAEEGEPEPLPEVQESEPLSFAVRFADDLDASGYPDDPFKALPGAGDEWHGYYETNSCSRLVMAVALKNAAAPVTVYMPNPANMSQLWTITIPAGLVLSGERAVLMLAKACDEFSLYAPETAHSSAGRPGAVVPGAGFWEAHIVVSTDAGKTFDEMGPERLGERPLAMQWSGLRPTAGNTTALYGRDAHVEGDGTSGLRVLPGGSPWTRDGIRLLEAPETAGRMLANISRAGALGPFQTPQPPRLVITPGGAAGRFGFGIVRATQAATQEFTLSNTGSQPLTGTVVLDDPSGVFALIQPPDYSIPPGRSTTMALQFIPPVAGDYITTLTFSGGDTGPQTLTITGSGSAKPPKVVVAFGCGGAGAPRSPGAGWADLAVLAAALGLLAAGVRRVRA